MNHNLTLSIDAPYLSAEEYAKRTGQTKRAVATQCQKGQLPVKPRSSEKGTFFINMVLLFKQANAQEY